MSWSGVLYYCERVVRFDDDGLGRIAIVPFTAQELDNLDQGSLIGGSLILYGPDYLDSPSSPLSCTCQVASYCTQLQKSRGSPVKISNVGPWTFTTPDDP